MPSINRRTFYTIALSLILSLFCLQPELTTFAFHNPYSAYRSVSHSPAYKKGMNALSKSDFETAAEHFKQAAADKPDDMWAFYYLGLCLLRLKRFDEAANATKQAMALKSTEAAVRYQLGIIYLAIGDREAAEKERRWLQEYDQELARYLSDPLPADKATAQQTQNASASSANDKRAYEPMTASLRPSILYREAAKYTEIARTNRVQGVVVLQVVFAVNGEIQITRIIRALPDGLTHKAIEAARKIGFKPAKRDGTPVSVQGQLEFIFHLY